MLVCDADHNTKEREKQLVEVREQTTTLRNERNNW
jgi:hypothetical protein